MSRAVSVRETSSKGFTLNEQEIRRIYSIITQQMKAVVPSDDYESTFTLTFKNKIEEQKTNIDDIFAESNGGAWEIQKLDIKVHYKYDEEIRLKFEKNSSSSIYYSIEGKDRNWVFLTKSYLDERIKSIAKQLFFRDDFISLSVISTLVLTYIGTLVLIIGKLIFPSHVDISIPFGDLIVILLLLLFLGIAALTYFICFTPYNFSWGDYKQAYEKRQAGGKFILIGVLLAVILSIIGGIVANYLTIRIGVGH